MKTIKISLLLLLYCTTMVVQNNNNMDNIQSMLEQAVLNQNEEFLKQNLTPENVNELHDVPIGIMHITYRDGESDKPIFGKGSLLHLATFHNLPKSAKILIENGADVNAKNSEGQTPLQGANNVFWNNAREVQKALIENGADMNFYTNRDVPLLYQYIWNEQYDLAELAIENGADVNMKAKDGESILEFAKRRGTPKIVSMLQNTNKKLNEKWTAIYKTEDTESQKSGAIEIAFRPDGTFRYDERHPGESVSYANGTYYYIEQKGEIFVHVESGGYDWVTRPATETTPPLYWGEVYFNYQFYFKITQKSESTIAVIEHVANHEGVSNTVVWKEMDGNYSLVASDQSMMKEKQYILSPYKK
jgi:FOG: Ankyrin repeat